MSYYCIECGALSESLVTDLDDVLRLVRCDSCLNVADKYIEVDRTLLLLELLLHRPQAYRHLLLNRKTVPSARLLSVCVIAVNYLVQLAAIRRAGQEVRRLWFRLILTVVLEHLAFVGAVFLGLRLLPNTRYIVPSHKMTRIIYIALAIPELGKVCAILDWELALLLCIGCLILSIQHKSLQSICLKYSGHRLLVVVITAALLRSGMRLLLNRQLASWCALL